MKKIIKIIGTCSAILAATTIDWIDVFGPKLESKFSEPQGVFLQNQEIMDAETKFFRQSATFQLVETNEIIEIDYVFSCLKIKHNSAHDFGIVDANVDQNGNYSIVKWFPEAVFEASSTGEILQVRTFPICNLEKFPEIVGKPHPFTVLHNGLDSLSEGWGYKTYHAYENSNSKIRFLDGSLNLASQTEFLQYLRERQKKSDPSSIVTFGKFGPEAAMKWSLKYDYEIQNSVASNCLGVASHKLTENLIGELRSLQPKSIPTYWYANEERENRDQQMNFARKVRSIKLKRDIEGNGYFEKNTYFHEEGTPAFDGSNTIINNHKRKYPYIAGPPKPIYPIVPIEAGVGKILLSDEFKGLEYCYSKRLNYNKMYVNDTLVEGQKSTGPIFDIGRGMIH